MIAHDLRARTDSASVFNPTVLRRRRTNNGDSPETVCVVRRSFLAGTLVKTSDEPGQNGFLRPRAIIFAEKTIAVHSGRSARRISEILKEK